MYKIPSDEYRVQDPRIPYEQNRENCPDFGGFILPPKIGNRKLICIASNGGGWEHVSVSGRQGNRPVTPTWEEMCYVKSAFWDEEDCVIQYHPPRSEYVNCHPNCLHLWRPTGFEIPTPPAIYVGPKPDEIEKYEEAIRRPCAR